MISTLCPICGKDLSKVTECAWTESTEVPEEIYINDYKYRMVNDDEKAFHAAANGGEAV